MTSSRKNDGQKSGTVFFYYKKRPAPPVIQRIGIFNRFWEYSYSAQVSMQACFEFGIPKMCTVQ